MRSKRAIVGVVGVLFCASAVGASAGSGGGSRAGAKAPVHLALISFQVPGGDTLGPMSAGARAAAKQINAAGGFGGRKLVIDTCNSMLSPAVSTTCAQRLVGKRPVAMFGCEIAWTTSGVAVFSAKGIPSVNCLNGGQDFTNPWTFGVTPGAIGQLGAAARYACSRPDIHRVAGMVPDFPVIRDDLAHAGRILQACGKPLTVSVYVPYTAVDMTPFVQQVAQSKPDFVLTSGTGAQAVASFKTFAQNGIPASKISAPDVDFTTDLVKAAGSTMEGAVAVLQFGPWSNTKDPEVAAYLKAVKGSADARDPSVMWGYADVMFFYTAARQIGFDKFNSASLTRFLKTSRSHIPLSRSLFNPGPKDYPQVRQPYGRITQWKNGKFQILPVGAKKDGWVYGF